MKQNGLLSGTYYISHNVKVYMDLDISFFPQNELTKLTSVWSQRTFFIKADVEWTIEIWIHSVINW